MSFLMEKKAVMSLADKDTSVDVSGISIDLLMMSVNWMAVLQNLTGY